VTALQESVRLSTLATSSGLADYFEVLEAQQQLFPAEIALAQARSNQLVAAIRLYRVLGGGWNIADPTWAPPATTASLTPSP
jgi:multidrug efflux system outer membrane protein